MTKRIINTKIEEHLLANEPFEYAHLIKFERPFAPKNGQFRENANRYVYLTDAARDITFHGNTYIANRIQTVGAYSETVEAKSTNMSLTLSGEPLGLSYTVTGNLSSGSFVGSGVVNGDVVDFVRAGFIEGDKVKVTVAAGGNFSDGDSQKVFIISAFSNDNKTLTLERTGTDSDDSAFVSLSSTALKFELDSEEINSATLSSGGATPSFLNREVFIYKVFFDPNDLSTPIGATSPSTETDNSVLVFKGIISSTNIQEAQNSSRVQWNLTSHWGDFEQISGRITTDEIHRALGANGQPDHTATFRPLHATDLGFSHAETSLNTMATYQTSETRYEYKLKKKWYGKSKLKEIPYEHIEDHDVDLNVYLSGKYLPVVYGVQRLPGIPVFADVDKTDPKQVYVAYAISEGENHGIYNVYIDGQSLLCVDATDSGARGVGVTGSQQESLQCYGRMDRGQTLGGSIGSGTETTTHETGDYGKYEVLDYNTGGTSESVIGIGNVDTYINMSELAAGSTTLTAGDAEGLQHRDRASINHPFDIQMTFHSGRHDQQVDSTLASKAGNNGFLRQSSYYDSSEPYWGGNHRLVDTAYAVMKFNIDADMSTIPEVEYVVKGKVLENYNYDGTYVRDTFAGASDSANNFNEGDTVTVEVSSGNPTDSGSLSYSALSGTFRILDKYNFTNSRGTSYHRFRLDSIPNLNYDSNGVPAKKYLRLKNSNGDYYHMQTWNADLVSTATAYPHTTNRITPTSISTNGQGQLQAVLSDTEESRLHAFFGTSGLTGLTTPIYLSFSGSGFSGVYSGLPLANARATYNSSTNTLTFLNTFFQANQTLSGTMYLQPATIHHFSFSNLSSSEGDYYAVGSMLEIVETGEQREITAWNNGYARISSPFVTTPTGDHTYKIVGKGRDLRATSNPAIQTMDMLTNDFYGKGLDPILDIDLDSIKTSARLCDARSDVTLDVDSATVKKGDLYKLQIDGNHIASGKVKEDVTSGTRITFEEVSGKFLRAYQDYINYNVGDIVYSNSGNTTNYYKVGAAGFRSSAPTHTSGTNGNWTYVSAVELTKISASSNANSPATLTLKTDLGIAPSYSLYDSDFVKYWRYIGWEENRQWCVTRHQTNGVIDTGKSVFNNINGMLSHFNGILSYSNGKYVLGVETQENTPTSSVTFNSVTYDWNVNPEYIDETDIIGTINLNDNSQKNSKNTVKGSIFDPQNNFGSRSITFYNSDFLKADRNVIKTGNINLPAVTSYYNARLTVEKYLMESRFSKEISFTLGPKGLLLKPGEVISINYAPFGFENKRFRIKNLNFNQNCNVSVKATEYDDSMYVISAQAASRAQRPSSGAPTGQDTPSAPSGLSTGSTNKPGVIRLSWTNATDYIESKDSTEIWRASSQGSSGDITSHATLLGVIDEATTFTDAVGDAGTFYYWIRHRRTTRNRLFKKRLILTGDFSTAITGGVAGTAKPFDPQLEVDVSSMQIKFNDSGNLSPSGSAQDVTLTATLRSITPDSNGVQFSIVNADQSSQSDVQFSNNNSNTYSDTSSPYQAIVDASTASTDTTNKFIKVTVTSTEGDTFTKLVPLTVTRDGISGGTGIAAAAVKIEPSTHVITYSANDPDNENPATNIIFSTELQGNTGDSTSAFSGSPFYEFLVDGTTVGSILSSGTRTIDGASYAFNAFRLPQANEPEDGETVEVKVKVRDGSTTGTVKASDSVTIFGLKSGSDSITAFLTNPSHVVSAANDGTVSSFTGSGGSFKVLVGTSDQTSNCTFADSNATSGLTQTINTSTGAYSISGLSQDFGSVDYTVTIPDSVSPTGTGVSITQTYSISKSKQGNVGAGGQDARTVKLTANNYTIVYDQNGENPAPSTAQDILLTATAQGFGGTNQANARFQFTGDGITDETSYTAGTNGTDTIVFQVPATHFTSPQTIKVSVADSGDLTEEIAFDTITINAVKEGTNAYTVVLDNEAHAIPADNDGSNPVMTGSGCTIRVFKGSTPLTRETSGSASAGKFTISTSGNNITPNSSPSGTTVTTFGNHSNLTAATADITYTLDIEGQQTVVKKQTFTRVDNSLDGDTIKPIFLYHSGTSTPTAPADTEGFTASTGNAAAGTFQGAAWATTPGNPTTTNNIYVAQAEVTQVNSTGNFSVTGSWAVSVHAAKLPDDGTDAQAISLSASSQIFELPKNSATLTPSSITLTANRQNISNSTTFSTNPTGINLGGSGDTATLSNSDFGNNTAVTVTATAGSFSDSVTIVKVEEGTDALVAVLGNESHTFQANNAGTVSDFSGGTTTIQVFEGATALTFTTGTAGNGEFTVSRSASGITQSGFSGDNTTTCTTSAPTAMSGDSATITYTIAGKRANGTAFSLSKVQSFAKSKTGAEGDPGNKIALVKIYKSATYSAGRPTTPSNSSYDFSTDTFTIGSTNTSNGWSTTVPTSTVGYSIWECEKVVTGAPTATNVTVAWPTPEFFNPFFDFSPIVFKRGDPAPSKPGDGTANPPAGWSATIPSGSDPVYQSKGTGSFSASFAITYTWSDPVKVTGDTGGAGQSVKTVELFKKNDSSFGFTSGNDATSQDFDNPTTGVESGWSTTQPDPTNPGDKIYMVRRTFTSDGQSPQDSSWSSPPVIVAQLGDGVPRSARVFIYHQTSTTVPSDTSTGTPYNFETGVFTVPTSPSGWSTTRPSRPYFRSQVDIAESSFDGNQNVEYNAAMRIGGAGGRDPGDWTINFDDSNNKLKLIVDGTTVSEPGYSTSIRNDDLRITNDGTNLRIRNSSNDILDSVTGLSQSLVGLSGVQNNADQTSSNTAAGFLNQGDLATRDDVRAGTHIKDSTGTVLGNDDIKNSSLDVAISGTAIKLKIGATETSTVTATQGLVGLSGVQNNADQTSSNTAADTAAVDGVSAGTVKAGAALGATAQQNNSDKTAGHVGGWDIDDTAIFSGTKDTSGYTTGGITLNSAGSIHSQNFYIDTSGNAKFRGEIDAAGGTFTGELTIDNTDFDVSINNNGALFGGTTFTNSPLTINGADGVLTSSSSIVVGASSLSSGDGFALSGAGDIRLFAGNDGPSTSPLTISKAGKLFTKNLEFYKGDLKYFDATNGFSSAAISQIATELGTAVTSVTEELSGISDVESITLTEATTLTVTAFKDAIFSASSTTSSTAAFNDLPANFTLTVQVSTDNSNWSDLSGGSRTFTVTSSSTPTATQYSTANATDGQFIQPSNPSGGSHTQQTTFTESTSGTMSTVAATYSASAGTVYFRVAVSTTDTSYDTSNDLSNSTSARGITISAPISFTTSASSATAVSDLFTNKLDGGKVVFGLTSDTDNRIVLDVDGSAGSGATDYEELEFYTGQGTSSGSYQRFGIGRNGIDCWEDLRVWNESFYIYSNSTPTDIPSIEVSISNGGDASFSGSLRVGATGSHITNGVIEATNDIIAFYSSDKRLKENVSPLSNSLEKISNIRGVEFDWIQNHEIHPNEGHDIGVIAQEVEKVAPEIVITRDNGYKAVNYQKLTVLLIEAVKELKEEIKELKKDK